MCGIRLNEEKGYTRMVKQDRDVPRTSHQQEAEETGSVGVVRATLLPYQVPGLDRSSWLAGRSLAWTSLYFLFPNTMRINTTSF